MGGGWEGQAVMLEDRQLTTGHLFTTIHICGRPCGLALRWWASGPPEVHGLEAEACRNRSRPIFLQTEESKVAPG